mmetsp:Transcript_13315/g.29293  ORF Transcript_13315/g.29293 Transcript_13315/m.29293 type:complete len:146 (-) Transcript_13315:800-1237(-)
MNNQSWNQTGVVGSLRVLFVARAIQGHERNAGAGRNLDGCRAAFLFGTTSLSRILIERMKNGMHIVFATVKSLAILSWTGLRGEGVPKVAFSKSEARQACRSFKIVQTPSVLRSKTASIPFRFPSSDEYFFDLAHPVSSSSLHFP